MTLFLVAMGLVAMGGVAALATGRSARAAAVCGAGSAVAGCTLALAPAFGALLGAQSERLQLLWNIPGGSFSVALDPVSGFFLVPTLLLSALAALYGTEYLRAFRDTKSLGGAWFCFNLLVVSMAMVLVAAERRPVPGRLGDHGAGLLLPGDIRARAGERPRSRLDLPRRHAPRHRIPPGAVHAAGRRRGLARFRRLRTRGRNHSRAGRTCCFLLAVIGFGTKAGFVPLHVWLPEAHPAAPSHVSAVMSGVMIKTGIYGLVRTLLLSRTAAGVVGMAAHRHRGDVGHSRRPVRAGPARPQAAAGLPQRGEHRHHHPRAGARHARASPPGSPRWPSWDSAGGLLHVINHALFKGLLFLGAGAVLHATGTREIDLLGGLQRRMPWTGTTFLIGAAAISGLPPLNGFVSEFLIYLGAFLGAIDASGATGVVVSGLVAIGGTGAHRRTGRGLFHQGVRHRLPGRAAKRPRGARARGGSDHAMADADPCGGVRGRGASSHLQRCARWLQCFTSWRANRRRRSTAALATAATAALDDHGRWRRSSWALRSS